MKVVKCVSWIGPVLVCAYLTGKVLLPETDKSYEHLAISWAGVLGFLLLGLWFRYGLTCTSLVATSGVGIVGIALAGYISLTIDIDVCLVVALEIVAQLVWLSYMALEARASTQWRSSIYLASLQAIVLKSGKTAYISLRTTDFLTGSLFLSCLVSLSWLLLATQSHDTHMFFRLVKNSCMSLAGFFFISLALNLFPRGLVRLFLKTPAHKRHVAENTVVTFVLGGLFVFLGLMILRVPFVLSMRTVTTFALMLWGALCIGWHCWVSHTVEDIDKEAICATIDRIKRQN